MTWFLYGWSATSVACIVAAVILWLFGADFTDELIKCLIGGSITYLILTFIAILASKP